MPSTWTAYSRRKSICKAEELKDDTIYGCWEILPDITEGEIIVRVRESTVTVDFHTQCWLKTAVELMKLTPYLPAGKGRRKLPISDEDSARRKKVSNRYSAFQSRINNYSQRIMNDDPNLSDLNIAIQIMKLKQDQLWHEMKGLGGTPERWRVPDGEDDKEEEAESSAPGLLPEEQDESPPLDAGAA